MAGATGGFVVPLGCSTLLGFLVSPLDPPLPLPLPLPLALLLSVVESKFVGSVGRTKQLAQFAILRLNLSLLTLRTSPLSFFSSSSSWRRAMLAAVGNFLDVEICSD